MLEGHPISECGADGRWSNGVPPRCVRACAFPGGIVGGAISSVRFFYPVGEVVSFRCFSGRNLVGADRMECLGDGVWSGAVPICVGA